MARYKFIGTKERTHDGSEQPIKHHEARPRAFQTANRAHWEAPAVMVASVLCGVAFAIGHDRFYHHFDNQQVGSSLQQKVIINVGTAFAFLVKMFFTIAAATVFSQQIFQSLKHNAETINDIDTLFDVFDNLLHFAKIGLWFRHFALATIAVVVWCLPIAAVFTPGTIHVQPSLKYDNNTQLKPAQPQQSWIGKQNFGSSQIDLSALFRPGPTGDTYADVILAGPSGSLYSVAIGSAGQRDVLSIPSPARNASYDLSFYGPALSCTSLDEYDLSTFKTAITAAQHNQYLPVTATTYGGVENAYNSTGHVVKYNAWIKDSTVYGWDLQHPNWNNGSDNTAAPTTDNTQYFYISSNDDDVLLTCHLHNATYDVQYTFENSEQSINVKSKSLHELAPWNATVDTDFPNYASVVYTSMLWAFNNIAIGAGINDTTAGAINQGVLYYNGAVSVSILRDLIEGEMPLTTETAIDALETMFTNLTLSILSSSSLRLADDQAKTITASTWRSVNVWEYEPDDLYIAYGCALLATLLCVLWGFYLVFQHNHLSYSIKFSTFLRTTRRKELDGLVAAEDRKGNDPLPKDMKEIKLAFGNTGTAGFQDSDGFRLAGSSGVDAAEHGHSTMTQEPSENSTFLPRIPDVAGSGMTADGTQTSVRRKPVPHAEHLASSDGGHRIFG